MVNNPTSVNIDLSNNLLAKKDGNIKLITELFNKDN